MKQYIKCNMNHKIRIKLNDKGIKIMHDNHNEMVKGYENAPELKLTEIDGYVELQFHEFVRIFGNHISYTQMPFETTIFLIEIEEEKAKTEEELKRRLRNDDDIIYQNDFKMEILETGLKCDDTIDKLKQCLNEKLASSVINKENKNIILELAEAIINIEKDLYKFNMKHNSVAPMTIMNFK